MGDMLLSVGKTAEATAVFEQILATDSKIQVPDLPLQGSS